MILENTLAYYGIFGLWTISNLALIWYLLNTLSELNKKTQKIIEENTKSNLLLKSRIDVYLDYTIKKRS